MRKQTTGTYDEDDVIDAESLRRGKAKKKNNANDSVKQVISGLDGVSNEIDEYRKKLERRGRPQVEVLEDERVLRDDAGFGETARYYYENAKDKAKGAWDEVAKPFRESKQMKKELKAQENIVKSKMSDVRKDAHKAMGEIALESRQEIDEMNRLNHFREEQYRFIEEQRDRELQEEIRKHEKEMVEMNKRFEKERKERKRALKLQANQAKKASTNTDAFSSHASSFQPQQAFSSNVSRFSMLGTFQGEGFFSGGDGFLEEPEENIDVNTEMKVLIEVMGRSKLEQLSGGCRIVFRNHEDALEFCAVFNRVIYPLGICDYKFSDFNSGMGESPDYYSVGVDNKELEIVESFKRSEMGTDTADYVKRF